VIAGVEMPVAGEIIARVARRLTSPALVERAEQLSALTTALDLAADGHPSVSLITGEPGVGKSRLVAELKRHADASQWLVLEGGCVQLEDGECPYLPVVGALRDVAWGADAEITSWLPEGGEEELARILPDLGPAPVAAPAGTAPYSPGGLHELLLLLLRGLSRERPVEMVLEDLHWADGSTRDFLSYLARNLRDERVAVVVTYRDGLDPGHPLSQLVGELLRRDTVGRHTIRPLTLDGTRALLCAILDEVPSPQLVEHIHAGSQGNPFYAEELLAARSGDPGGPLPSSLREVVLARCAELDDAALSVVRLAAAVARPLEAELIAAAGVPEPAASRAIRQAMAHHILRSDPDHGTIAFRHAIVREILYADLLPGERRALHAAIARALSADTAAHPAELAHHWSAAGDHPAALAASVRAGLAAAYAYASAEAAEHLAGALSLWDSVAPEDRPAGVDRVDLLAHAAEATRATGDFDGAVAYCRQALRLLDAAAEPIRAARLHERIGRYRPWDLQGSLDCYARALELLGDTPTADRARILGDEALTLMLMVKWPEARSRCEEALAVARAADARAEEGYARATLGLVLAYLGDAEEGERQLREAVALVEEFSHAEDCARAYMHLAEVERLRGRYAEAMELTRKGIVVARRLGDEGAFGAFMSVNLADDLFLLGRWDEADGQLSELQSERLASTGEVFRDTLAGQLAVARGDFEAASASFERAGRDRAGLLSELLASLGAGLAELALWQRRPQTARDHVRETLAAIAGAEDRLYAPSVYALGVRALADLSERPERRERSDDTREEARALVDRLGVLLEATDAGAPPAIAVAQLRLAEAELARALAAPSPQAWAEAAAACENLGHPYPAAYARFREAEASIMAGVSPRDVGDVVRAAQMGAAELGALPLLREIEALAKRARVAPAVEPEPAAVTGADELGLTRREVEVLRLVAHGLSNRQIADELYISSNTAGVHVSHILSKLNVSSRVLAAGVAHRAGLLDEPPGS
jgi:DNA-binding NarL/FixJ family response regulator